MLKIIKPLILISTVGLLAGTAYTAGGEEGLIALLIFSIVVAFIIFLLRSIPPLFWTIFFAVGFAIVVFG